MCTQYSVFLYSLTRYGFLWWSLSFTRRSFFYRGESYICCGYKDKYLDSNLEVHWLRNRTVVGSSLGYMTSLTTSGWLGSQTQAWIILHRVDLKSNYVAVCYCWDISTIVAPPPGISCLSCRTGHYCGSQLWSCIGLLIAFILWQLP